MKQLYISRHAINDNQTIDGCIGCVIIGGVKWWYTGLQCVDNFIINSYHFDKYIFFVDYLDIELIGDWDIGDKKVDIIIRNCIDKRDALHAVGADYNLNINVYFYNYLKF
jgi:hypothetical protein